MGSWVKLNKELCEMSNKLRRYDIQYLMSAVILPGQQQVTHIYELNRTFLDILEPTNKQTLTTH